MKKNALCRSVVFRLPRGSDLLEELTRVASEEKITLAEISGIGALSRAKLGVFLPGKNTYRTHIRSGELEICSLQGNVSLKDGRPFVHAHVVLSDLRSRAWGGHLLPGCRVFVAEVILKVLTGAERERKPDEECGGLYLWPARDRSTRTRTASGAKRRRT